MEETCLHEFVSHIEGKNATVRIYPDRIEWDRAGRLSAGRATLGVFTGGYSLKKTGIRSGKGTFEVIPVKSLTSVTAQKDGLQMKVTLIASGNTIEMRIAKGEALAVRDTLTRLMLGTHPSQQESEVPPPTAPPAPPPPAADEAPDPMVQLKKLKDLQEHGLISNEEYEAKRQAILDRL